MKRIIPFYLYIIAALCFLQPVKAQNYGNWKQVGPIAFPINVSGQIHGIGRTTQLKFHPSNAQKMYATTATGGVYISTDGGNNWTVTGTDNLLRQNCASICIDYTNDQILYLGTGDPNYYSTYTGIMKSTDGGATWNTSNSGIGNRMALEILMSPLDHNVLIAATNDGIWKSTNAGASWTVKKSGGAFKDMIFKPAANSSTIYAVNDNEFWLSNNMGDTWTQVSLPGSGNSRGGRIAVSKADPNVVYVSFVGDFNTGTSTPVLKSTNSGVSFSVVKPAGQPNLNGYEANEGGQNNYNYHMTADPANANIVYVVGHVVWKSTNGGVSWTQLTKWYAKVHTDMHHIVVSPYNGSQLWNSNDGGIWLSTDGGNNWTPKSNGLGCTEIYHASQSPVRKDLMDIGTQDNGELHYINNTWYTNGGGDYSGITAFDHQNTTDVYHLNDGTRKRLTGSGGAPALTLPFSVNNEVTLATNPLQTNTAFICQTDIYRTTNLSGNPPGWTKISNINIQMKDLRSSPADINLLYAVSNSGKFYRSDNATAASPTFTTYNTPAATNNNASIAPIKSNANIVYLSCGSRVFRSADKGASWTEVTNGLPNVNIINILHDPYSTDESVYVGMATGVWYKNNTMTSWINYSKGLPTVATLNEIMIFTDGTSNSEIRVGFYGRGVWGSTLYGADNLPVVAISTPVDGAAFAPNSNISITASATGKAGATISKVEFFSGATLIGTATTSPYTITWNNVPTGNYQLTAKATDSKGAVNTSSIVRIGVQNLREADKPTNPVAGIDYKYFEGGWSVIPDFNSMTPVKTGISTTGFDISFRNRDDQFGFNFTGYIQVPTDGIYTFYTSSDDGSRLYIGTTLVVDNDGLHGNTEQSGAIGLKAGRHAIRVDYFENGADHVCDISYQGPNIGKQIIPATVLFRATPGNAAPTVSITAPANNSTFAAGSNITFTVTASDADGTISKVEYLNGTTLIGTSTTSPFSFTWNNVAAGTYSITARATDNANATGVSSVITIVVNPLRNPENPANTISGLDYKYYEGLWNALPDFNTLSAVETGSVANYDLSVRNRNDQFGFSFTGYVNIPTDGSYTFYTSSDDGSRLYIGTTLVVDNDGLHGTQERSGTIGLKAGKHAITVVFFEQGGGEVLTVSYSGPAIAKATIPNTSLFRINPAPTVSVTAPANNTTVVETTVVAITASASDANGTISKVEFFIDGTKIGESATSPYSINWTSTAGTHTITAKATDNDGASTTSSGININVTPLRVPENPTSTVAGIDYSYYEGNWSALPNFTTLTPAETGVSTTAFDLIYRNRDDQFGFSYTGYINITTDGIYTFYTSSDDGSKLYIGTTEVVSNDGLHGPQERSGTIGLKAGKHAIKVVFFEQGGGQVLTVSYSGPSLTKTTVPASVLFRNNTGTNNPPAISITSPANNANFSVPANITLNANATDSDGSITQVEFFNGSTSLGVVTTSPYSVTWNNVPAGTYSLTAVARDNSGANTTSAAISVTVTCPAITTTPYLSVNGAAWQNTNTAALQTGNNITFGPHPVDGGTWAWTGPNSYTASTREITLNNVQTNQAGNYVGTYTNTDGCKATVTYNITVTPPANQLPAVSITAPANNATYTAPASIAISASASDPDGNITKVEFFNGITLIGTATSAPYNFTWTNVAGGTYSITAKATDNASGTATSSVVNVVVNAPNQSPIVSITSPSNNASFNAPATVSITASASDPDGSIAKVEFFNGATLIGTVTTSPYTMNWNNITAGTYTLSAKATDNSGAVTASAGIVITVSSGNACSGIPSYSENGGYAAGSRVQNGNNLYECKPWPYSGWCNGSAWAYSPGDGMYWTDAWTLVGPCSGAKTTTTDAAISSLQSAPNPFDNNTTLSFEVAQDGNVVIAVYNEYGIMVSELFNGNLNAGSHAMNFTMNDLPAGKYICKVQSTDKIETMSLIKAARPKKTM